MVELRVFLALKYPGQHGPGGRVPVGGRVVYGPVHELGGVRVAHEAAEGEVVVPGYHGEQAVLLVEVVVVDRASRVTVEVADEVVRDEVADDALDVHAVGDVAALAQLAQGVYEPVLVRVGGVGLGVVEDVGVAVVVVVRVDQQHVAAAAHHPAAHAAAHLRHLAHIRNFTHLGHLAHIRHPAHVLRRLAHVGWHPARSATAAEAALTAVKTALLRHFLALRRRKLALAGHIHAFRQAELTVFKAFLELVHVEAAAVAAAAAHVAAVGLVELAVVRAVAAQQEALLHALNGQIQPPILAVHRYPDVAAKRRVRARRGHELIAQVVLHVGVVLDDVVEVQLVEAVVAQGAVVVVELYLEAVPVVAVGRDGAEGGVALGAYARAGLLLAVYYEVAHDVFLVLAAGDEVLPVVHDDVYGVDLGGVEKPLLIAERDAAGGGREAQRRRAEGQGRDEHGQRQRRYADAVELLAG